MKIKGVGEERIFITETQKHKVPALYTSPLCAAQPLCLCVKKENENSIGLYKFELKVRGREKR